MAKTRKPTRNRPAALQFKPERIAKFLELLAEGNTSTFAARALAMGRTALYKHRKANAEFRGAWDEAIETGIETMEQEAFRRATLGVEKPVYQGGKEVGRVREFSDTLLIFLLKARRPDVYRDTVNHTGKIVFSHEDRLRALG